MSKFLSETTVARPSPFNANRLSSGLVPSDVRSAQPQSTLFADDPALVIGLALACVRQETALGGVVPQPVLMRLVAHARLGNPSARPVLDWLTRRNYEHATLRVSEIPGQ